MNLALGLIFNTLPFCHQNNTLAPHSFTLAPHLELPEAYGENKEYVAKAVPLFLKEDPASFPSIRKFYLEEIPAYFQPYYYKGICYAVYLMAKMGVGFAEVRNFIFSDYQRDKREASDWKYYGHVVRRFEIFEEVFFDEFTDRLVKAGFDKKEAAKSLWIKITPLALKKIKTIIDHRDFQQFVGRLEEQGINRKKCMTFLIKLFEKYGNHVETAEEIFAKTKFKITGFLDKNIPIYQIDKLFSLIFFNLPLNSFSYKALLASLEMVPVSCLLKHFIPKQKREAVNIFSDLEMFEEKVKEKAIEIVPHRKRNDVFSQDFDTVKQYVQDHKKWLIEVLSSYQNDRILNEKGASLLAQLKRKQDQDDPSLRLEICHLIHYFRQIPNMTGAEIKEQFPEEYFKTLNMPLVLRFSHEVHIKFIEGCGNICLGCPVQQKRSLKSLPYPIVILLAKAGLSIDNYFFYDFLFYKDKSGALFQDVMKLGIFHGNFLSTHGYGEEYKNIAEENIAHLNTSTRKYQIRVSVIPTDVEYFKLRKKGKTDDEIINHYVDRYFLLVQKLAMRHAVEISKQTLPEEMMIEEGGRINRVCGAIFRRLESRLNNAQIPFAYHRSIAQDVLSKKMYKYVREEQKINIWRKILSVSVNGCSNQGFTGDEVFLIEASGRVSKQLGPRLILFKNAMAIFKEKKVDDLLKWLVEIEEYTHRVHSNYYLEKREKIVQLQKWIAQNRSKDEAELKKVILDEMKSWNLFISLVFKEEKMRWIQECLSHQKEAPVFHVIPVHDLLEKREESILEEYDEDYIRDMEKDRDASWNTVQHSQEMTDIDLLKQRVKILYPETSIIEVETAIDYLVQKGITGHYLVSLLFEIPERYKEKKYWVLRAIVGMAQDGNFITRWYPWEFVSNAFKRISEYQNKVIRLNFENHPIAISL